MGAYVLKRTISSAMVILGLSMVNFYLLYMLPGDTAEMLALAKYGAADATAEAIERLKVQEGLDKPFFVQYGIWLWGAVRGDLGKSRISGKPVWKEIRARIPATFQLALAALTVSLSVGIVTGTIAAMKRNTKWDYLCSFCSLLAVSIPNFWLGLILIQVFGVQLGLLPTFGYGTIRHLVLPAVTVGLAMAGITARLTRSCILDVLDQEYIKTAKAKGLSSRIILRRHVMTNAAIPVITIAGIQFGYLLEGTVIAESIFAWPGIGRLLIDAIYNRDFPRIQGCVIYMAFVFSVVNLAVDILYACLDPRLRTDNNG